MASVVARRHWERFERFVGMAATPSVVMALEDVYARCLDEEAEAAMSAFLAASAPIEVREILERRLIVDEYEREAEHAWDFDARAALVEIVDMRRFSVDGVLRLSPRLYVCLQRFIGVVDRARMLGVDVDGLMRELDDGLGTIEVVVDPRLAGSGTVGR